MCRNMLTWEIAISKVSLQAELTKMEYEITLGQTISDVCKEKQLILPNSVPEDLGYKSFKEGKKNCLLEMRQQFTAPLKNCNTNVRDKPCSLKLTIQ